MNKRTTLHDAGRFSINPDISTVPGQLRLLRSVDIQLDRAKFHSEGLLLISLPTCSNSGATNLTVVNVFSTSDQVDTLQLDDLLHRKLFCRTRTFSTGLCCLHFLFAGDSIGSLRHSCRIGSAHCWRRHCRLGLALER